MELTSTRSQKVTRFFLWVSLVPQTFPQLCHNFATWWLVSGKIMDKWKHECFLYNRIQWNYSANKKNKKKKIQWDTIYTFTPNSYIKIWRLQIREKIIASLHLQVDLQLTQFLYIISKSSWIFNQISQHWNTHIHIFFVF